MTRLTLSLAAAGLLAIAAGAGASEYGDILFSRKVAGPAETPSARFPHWAHRIRFRCYVCHEEIFRMKAGANPITMDGIRAGKFCGVCHDGKMAFAAGFETCGRCHPE